MGVSFYGFAHSSPLPLFLEHEVGVGNWEALVNGYETLSFNKNTTLKFICSQLGSGNYNPSTWEAGVSLSVRLESVSSSNVKMYSV